MDREDIIRMAQESGMSFAKFFGAQRIIDGWLADLERFAARVAEHEREACAKVCMGRAISYRNETDPWAHEHVSEAETCAAAIRARGQA